MTDPITNDYQERKDTPMARGLLDYFPGALAEVSQVSRVANEQHNPGEEMHWARDKSTDHADCIIRHLVGRGTIDTDGLRHSAKVAWRALALLQEELEAEGAAPGRGSRFPETVELEEGERVPLDEFVKASQVAPDYEPDLGNAAVEGERFPGGYEIWVGLRNEEKEYPLRSDWSINLANRRCRVWSSEGTRLVFETEKEATWLIAEIEATLRRVKRDHLYTFRVEPVYP